MEIIVAAENAGWGEQALNKMAEVALSSQLDEVENLDVNVETDPGKLMQGEVDSLNVEGKGMVMEGDLRITEMDMELRNIGVDPLKAVFGNIELTRPTEGTAKVILTEDDLNRAFNSDFLSDKLRGLDVEIDGKPVKIDTQKVSCRLLADGKIALDAQIQIGGTGETKEVSFTAKPLVNANKQGVTLEDIQYADGKELSPQLTQALVQKTSELLNLNDFDLEGMSLKINQLEVQAGKLVIQAEALVSKIPSA